MIGSIEPLTPDKVDALRSHLARHRKESGLDGNHFMPFAPSDPNGPKGLDVQCVELGYQELGWQRWFVVQDAGEEAKQDGEERIVAHISLKSAPLRTALHRCEVGVGIEVPYRGKGLGRALMQHAIAFAEQVPSLAWIDLHVFAHNTPAVALYRDLGFVEVGCWTDRFRIDGQALDELVMALPVD